MLILQTQTYLTKVHFIDTNLNDKSTLYTLKTNFLHHWNIHQRTTPLILHSEFKIRCPAFALILHSEFKIRYPAFC